jgi:hypothetical protein
VTPNGIGRFGRSSHKPKGLSVKTEAAEEAAAALRASRAINAGQQDLTEESRLLLTSMLRNELRDELRIAVAEGMQAVLTNDEVWAKVFSVLQRQATERTGRFVLGGITAVFRKLLWIGLFAAFVYSAGGWALLKAVWAAMNRG